MRIMETETKSCQHCDLAGIENLPWTKYKSQDKVSETSA